MSIIPKTTPSKTVSPGSPSSKQKSITWRITTPKFQFKDLILGYTTMAHLRDVISYYKNRDLLFDTWGLAERYSNQDGLAVNLYGEPGTGKTMAAHAIANALGKRMLPVDYAEIESKYVGETAKNLTALFRVAAEHEAIIFFDEADALLSKRVSNMSSATDVSVNQTRSVLLTLLNDYKGIVLFATNYIHNYDPAFLRRIRFHISFHLPDASLREALWKQYIPSKMPCHVDYRALAERFDGVSGSDIAAAVFNAAVRAARTQAEEVSRSHLETAIQDIIDVKMANLSKLVRGSTEALSESENHRTENRKMEGVELE